MVLRGLSVRLDEAVSILKGVCSSLGITPNVAEKGKEIHVKLDGDGLLRLYTTSKGLTIDGSAGKNKGKNDSVLNTFNELSIEKVENKPTKFTVSNNIDKEKIKENIKEFCENNNISVVEKNVPYSDYAYTLTSIATNEKLAITQYASGSLTVQGRNWILWEDICYIIEQITKPDISDIFNRFCETEQEIKFSDEEKEIRKLLTDDLADFMYDYDLKYIISGYCIIKTEVKCPDYTIVYSSVLRSSEGLLKKILMDTGIQTFEQLTDRFFTFSKVFKGDSLKETYKNVIGNSDKAKGLEKLYNMIKLRNTNLHSGVVPPPTIESLEDCKVKFFECLETLKSGYTLVYE